MNQNDNNYEEACRAYEARDYEKAYELFYALALESDVSCQMNVANMLMHGLGVSKNEDRAFEWFEQAAINEDKEAQYIHAWFCIQNGDEKEGFKYLELSSKAEFLDAVYDLAGFYAQGIYGCEKDICKAGNLYEKAVYLGKKEALGNLFSLKKQEQGLIRALFYMAKNLSSFSNAVK
ncbi:MAG: hypothetical protein COA44_03085 [Arcobacter sp.]|nr:MAG: hypothetical protein COA44_03085 [Arcobacter sp.]